jgi:hypothetical protein
MNPEIDKNGTKRWWLKGRLHRIDGPAVEYLEGNRFWWFYGDWLTEQEWLSKVLFNEVKIIAL